jgi:hypothetical protein
MKIKTKPDIAIGGTEKWSWTVTESDVVLPRRRLPARGQEHRGPCRRPCRGRRASPPEATRPKGAPRRRHGPCRTLKAR